MMGKRFDRNLSNDSKKSTNLQRQLAEKRVPQNVAPDLTDFMNDMFFGTVEKKSYNLTGGLSDQKESYDNNMGSRSENNKNISNNSTSHSSSRLTEQWLDEAKRMVASSPSRCNSPSRRSGSPRFAEVGVARSRATSPAPLGDRRDPLSRSARRYRGAESISGEILLKSAKHNRNKSEPLDIPPTDTLPASTVHKWFSDILKPHNHSPPSPIPEPNPTVPPLPPTSPRRSRFPTQPQGVPTRFSRRTFKTTSLDEGGPMGSPATDTQLLSPPKNLLDSDPRRLPISSSTRPFQENRVLSPPKNLIESAHRRSISSTTCSTNKIVTRATANVPQALEKLESSGNGDLNGFLKEQRIKIEKILKGEMDGRAKIVLSGPSNSTSSMAAAICYAWLLENKSGKKKNGSDQGNVGSIAIVVPVMNMKREKMLKQRQVAWLFHHVGLDVTALLFSDEVDLEMLMMSKKLSMIVVGHDVLKTNGEVGSQCTILTDNYCEDAYDLLQTPILKKLMIAGILLDTQNLNMSGKLPLTRDSEAVQLLSVGSTPNYRNTLYDQLMQDQRDRSFLEALKKNYAKSPNSGNRDDSASMDRKAQDKKSKEEEVTPKLEKINNDKPKTGPLQTPSPAAKKDERGKNTFFLAKWFGFGK